jgi:protein-tyrosine phosphatase
LLLWPAASFAVVAAGYAIIGPRAMGKSPAGDFRWWARIVLLPYRMFVMFGWYVARFFTPGVASSEILPGVWLGRRVAAAELPPGCDIVIDMTSEIAVPQHVRNGSRRYLCVPTLDRGIPEAGAAERALDEAARVASGGGGVYIHCAQGFGRSAALVAALLIRRGECRDVDEAEARLRTLRPGVKLTRQQRGFVTQLTRTPAAPEMSS